MSQKMIRSDDKTATAKVVQRLAEIREHQKANGAFKRTADVVGVDEKARTVELSFSSEVEYQRWWGIEILGHNPEEINLERLNNDAAVLWMHDWRDQRGVVVAGSVRVENGIGRCVARYSKSEEGDKLFQDIVDKIVTKVSVGYSIEGIKLVEEREGVDVYRVTSWTPFEISNVSVAADDTIGVGRSAENPQEERNKKPAETSPSIKPNDQGNSQRTKLTMIEKTTRDGKGNLVRAMVDEAGKIVEVLDVLEMARTQEQVTRDSEQRGREVEQARVKAITDLGRTYGKSDLALQFISENKTADEFQRELLHQFGSERAKKPLAEQQRGAAIGLTGDEVRQYSIFKAIRAMADPSDKAAREAAAFELEASRAAAELYGKSPKGIIIPNDVLADRAFSTSSGGGSAVATDLMAGSFIELLRKKAWLMRRARTMGGLVGNVDIPRQNSAGQAYWVGEGTGPTASQPGLDQIAFTPKTVGAYTDITRRLLKQSTPDAERIVRDDILSVVGLEIDRVGIYGTGGENMPKGVKLQTGINSVDFASAGAPTFPELVKMETEIALDNADVDSMSYAFNAAMRGYMKSTVKFSSAGSATIWEPGNTVNGYATDVSNQIITGDCFFGNWQDMIIAMWGGLELTVDTAALALSGGLRLIALQDLDMNVRHVESFCWGSDLAA